MRVCVSCALHVDLYLSFIIQLTLSCPRQHTETTRSKQEQRDHRARPQTLQCHQHCNDQVAVAARHQSGHSQNGRHSCDTRGHREAAEHVAHR